LEDLSALIRELRDAALTGTILNPGTVRYVASELSPDRGLVVHLSAGTVLGSRPRSKVPLGNVAGAVALGADAVSVQVCFGDPTEDRMLAVAGRVVEEARSLGIPTLVMVDPPSGGRVGVEDLDAARHAVRAAAEIGADLVQANYRGPAESIREIVGGCPVPFLLAGGPADDSPEAFLDRIREAIDGGAAGLAVGRNLFQHPNPRAFAKRIGEAIFRGAPPEMAVEVRS
jgi:DhnA family fructose-bisphosphate aldolase class Ia